MKSLPVAVGHFALTSLLIFGSINLDLTSAQASLSNATQISYSGFTQDCIRLLFGLGSCNSASVVFSPSTDCCQALSGFNSRGCFCNGAVTTIGGPQLEQAAAFAPLVLSACNKTSTPVIKQPSSKNCPSETTALGVCGVPDWEIDEKHFDLFTALQYALLPDKATISNSSPNITALTASLSPFFTNTSLLLVPAASGNFTGLEDIGEYAALGNPIYNGGLFDLSNITVFPETITFGQNTLSLAFSYAVTFPSSETSAAPLLLSLTNLTAGFNISFEPCSSKVGTWVADFGQDIFYSLSKNYPTDLATCKGIQDVCTGKNSQYEDIWDCLKWFETLPSQSCSGKVNSGNSKNCKQLHFNLAKYKPDIHCFHLGKNGGPDPNGHFKCQDAVDCSDGLTPEAVFYNSTRAATLARAEGKRFVV